MTEAWGGMNTMLARPALLQPIRRIVWVKRLLAAAKDPQHTARGSRSRVCVPCQKQALTPPAGSTAH